MKKIMWYISCISLLGTAAVIRFLPDKVPMHYDLSGNIDRWGSKYEEFLFPAIIILMSVFWTLLIRRFESKAAKAKEEKEEKEALTNAKVLAITGICMSIMFTVEHGISLYKAFNEATVGAEVQIIDIGKVATVLAGFLLIILGNITTKTRINRVIGFRISWSMYNDNTWRRSNRFASIILMIVGLISVLAGLLIKSSLAGTLVMIGAFMAGTVISVIYAHRVYVEEIKKESNITQ